MMKFRKELTNVKPYVPGKPIEEVKRELGIRGNIIKLASNENPLGVSPKAIAAINKAVNEVYMYPDDSNYHLRGKLAQLRSTEPEKIMIGNGSVELLSILIQSVCSIGDIVIRSSYSFIMSLIAANLSGAKVINIPFKDFRHDVDSIVKQSLKSRASVVYIDNPNNPIGTLLNEDELKYIVAKVPSDTMVILDEAYNEYLEKKERVDSVRLFEKNKNVVCLSTFSKIFGLAGLRVGYMIANKEIMENTGKMRLPFNVNLLGQKAALAALSDNAFIRNSREHNKLEREYLKKGLAALGFSPIESHTNFITIDIGHDASKLFVEMQKRGIIVRPLANYGLPTFIRISIGLRKENSKLLKDMKEVLL